MTRPLRLTTAGLCVALATAVACSALTSPSTDARAVGPAVAIGVAGVAALIAGLLGWSPAIGAGVLLLGGGYGVSLIGHGGTFDGGVVVIAPALLVVAELGYWSLDARVSGAAAVWGRRAAQVASAGGAGAIAAGAVQAAIALPAARGLAVTAAGVAASAGVLLLAERLSQRQQLDH